ncbi:MAG: DEAD/DEAH box helicase [Candidatus Heimdallarchaeota archaeon]|nr:DEAD/DEAH box helicase [Candidatus Heimdallarchaeota archaeon]
MYSCPYCGGKLNFTKNQHTTEISCIDCASGYKMGPGFSKEDIYSKFIAQKKNTQPVRKSFTSKTSINFDKGKVIEEDLIIKKNAEIVLSKTLVEYPLVIQRMVKQGGYLPVYLEKWESTAPPTGSRVELTTLYTGLKNKLIEKGINSLYSFQEEAMKAIGEGKHTLISAPTGIGKTESFIIPIIQSILTNDPNPRTRKHVSALLLYPTKALAADQFKKIQFYSSGLGIQVKIFDGDTPTNARDEIYSNPPDILISNADMIHFHLMGNLNFQNLLHQLKFLVIDEIHLCSGYYGSNIIWLIRRLKRFSPNIQMIGASATISNAQQFTSTLFDAPVTLIEINNIRKSDMYICMLYPQTSSNLAIILKITSLFNKFGISSLIFGNGHRVAEMLNIMLRQNKIKSGVHRAGLSQKHRLKIEQDFRQKQLQALVSTPTLELGIDIGDLDSVISQLTNLTSFTQRIGRAGRSGQESYATLVLNGDDPISAYYARNPTDYLTDIPPAYVEPNNSLVSSYQLMAMMLDKPLEEEEKQEYSQEFQTLQTRGYIKETRKELLYPQIKGHMKNYSIRGIGDSIKIYNANRLIGERALPIGLKELHPGAIYLHGGNSYKISNFNQHAFTAQALRIPTAVEKTQAQRHMIPRILDVEDERIINGLAISYLSLDLTEIVDGYTRKNYITNELIEEVNLEEPVSYTYETKGFLLNLPKPIDFLDNYDRDEHEKQLMGTYHAVEHILIESANGITGGGASQIGGLSLGDTGLIIVYDGTAGGSGLSRLLFDNLKQGMTRSLGILELCPCKRVDGCPRCTYSYQCGNNNQPLNRLGAIETLKLVGIEPTYHNYNIEGLKTFI